MSAEEVIWDIKDFYRSGEVRDPSSEVYYQKKGVDSDGATGYNGENAVTKGEKPDGRKEDANLDHRRGRRGRTAHDDKGEMAQGAGNGTVANRDGGQGGVLSRGSGKALLGTDSEGVRVDALLLRELSDTKIKDAKGRLLAVYHATASDFDVFDKGDVGFHFGTAEQAQMRANVKQIDNPRYIRAYLNVKNPIYSPRDTMGWHAAATALNLWSLNILTDSETTEIKELAQKNNDEYHSDAAVRLREILMEKGYDGIIYPNGHEGEGWSYIVFRDDQIVRSDKKKSDGSVKKQAKPETARERDLRAITPLLSPEWRKTAKRRVVFGRLRR